MLLRTLPLLALTLNLGCRNKADDFETAEPVLDSDTGDTDPVDSDTDTDDSDTDDSDTGTDPTDADGDGYPAGTEPGEDCDDTDGDVNPGAVEVCDDVDNDCDDLVDDDPVDAVAFYVDADGDTYGDPASEPILACDAPEGYVPDATDCDDGDAAYHPGAEEADCTDQNDYNCDGSAGDDDADGDGFVACEDCDDGAASVNPDAAEVCNDLDDDCDSLTDDADDSVDSTTQSTWYPDADADTFGDNAGGVLSCDAPLGTVADDTDCDDTTAAVNPDASEVCNGVDDDCDTLTDDEDDSLDASTTSTWYTDEDADGYGAGDGIGACDAPLGTAMDAGDCDDTNAMYHPNADESDCTDPNDYNCDGSVGFADDDGDGYAACEECDDTNAAVSPSASEVCNGLDDDCDTLTDDADSSVDPATQGTTYADGDGDGFGDPASMLISCEADTGRVTDDTDCDGASGAVNPDADEVCNDIDDDCDTLVDDADDSLDASTGSAWYTDEDGDAYGAGEGIWACDAPAGTATDAGDCDDTSDMYNPGADELDCTDPNDYNCDGSTGFADDDGDGWAACEDCDDANTSVNPDAAEICDADDTDEDCDGSADDGDSSVDASTQVTYHTDADGDTWGDANDPGTLYCDPPTGTYVDASDCDDSDVAVNPGASEVCNSVDDDCDALIDDADPNLEASSTTTWYADDDGDGFGSDADYDTCVAPAGTVTNPDDCDDAEFNVNPAATEVCDDIDNDCDGAVDDYDDGLDGGTTTSWYTDADGDTFGAGTAFQTCDPPDGTVLDATDCDDADEEVNPAASEVCNDLDDDCDSLVDDADGSLDTSTAQVSYTDADSDGYGAGSAAVYCDTPAGNVDTDGDCNDGDDAIHPDATEICDAANTDEDCNSLADDDDPGVDATTQTTYYPDDDGDSFGDESASPQLWCDPEGALVTDSSDCDDTDASSLPGGTEVCDDHDNDCDGAIDWGNRVPSDYATIQEAIDGVSDGEIVCVEAGTYTEQIDLSGKGITLRGTDGVDATVIDGGGVGPVVSVISGEGTDTVLTGLTISGGSDDYGAGVYLSGSSPTLLDLVITGNTCVATTCQGTGLYASAGSPVLDNVTVTANSATATTVYGAGAMFSASAPTVVDSQFSENTASSSGNVYGTGLALYNCTAGPSFENILVEENITTLGTATDGDQYGSLYVYYSNPVFDMISVSANEGYDGYNVWSSGVAEYGATSTYTHARVDGNIADTYYADAAALREMYSVTSWTNASFSGNQVIATYAILSAGAFLDRSSTITMTNVDISGNHADGNGTVYAWSSGIGIYDSPVFKNVNIVGNTTANVSGTYAGGVWSAGYGTFTYSNIYGNTGTQVYGVTDPTGSNGNISVDPMYADTSAADARDWDLSLGAGSPAIDAGDPSLLDADGTRSDVGGEGGPGSGW